MLCSIWLVGLCGVACLDGPVGLFGSAGWVVSFLGRGVAVWVVRVSGFGWQVFSSFGMLVFSSFGWFDG